MARDDYRIRIELPEEHHLGLLTRLGIGTEADELAEELEGRRLVVSRDGNEVFVYASSPQEAEQARTIVDGVLRRFRYLIVGAETRVEADELAKRLHGEVEPSSAYVWQNVPQNPFIVFGGLGGTGTPL